MKEKTAGEIYATADLGWEDIVRSAEFTAFLREREQMLAAHRTADEDVRLVLSQCSISGLWTLYHEFDAASVPLDESRIRCTVLELWRLTRQPARLLTMKPVADQSEHTAQMQPYQYRTDDGKTVLEQWLSNETL